jgi:hypothetical protein
MLLYISYQYSAIHTIPHRSDHTCNVPARAFNGPRHPLLGSIQLPLSLSILLFQHPGRTERYANTRHRNADAKPSHKFETLLQSDHTVQGIKIANPGFSRQIIVKQLLSPPPPIPMYLHRFTHTTYTCREAQPIHLSLFFNKDLFSFSLRTHNTPE